MQVPVSRNPHLVLFLLFFLGLLPGCGERNQYVEPPPPGVTVSKPLQMDVVDYLEFTGTTQSVDTVDIRARVQGFLQNVFFKDGANVNKDDLLYIIDPRTYQAAVDKARADLDNRRAQLEKTEIEYQRNVRLYKENAASQRDLDNSKANRDSAKAAVAAATAALEEAQINLGYTTIRAPIEGRIGRSLVDVGNLVGAGEYTLLATIKDYDPIYAFFTISERELLRIMKMQREEGKIKDEYRPELIPVELGLSNESGYPHKGTLDFADLGVDPSTGTILMRGIFPNPDPYVLLPGLFVRLRLPIGLVRDALLVTDRALGADQQGKYLLVVNQDHVVEYRPVKTGPLVNGMRVIEEGLKADEWVVVNGIQRARPGAKVNPIQAEQGAPAAVQSQPNPVRNKPAGAPAKP